MQTPIYDFVVQYAKEDPVRMHMPGHKGRLGAPLLQDVAALDLTEIEGADSLFEASGIIAESEENAARLFGAADTFYSCAGSTLCIQTMLYLMKQEGRTVVAARNVHRAFLHACVLLDIDVIWVYPEQEETAGLFSQRYKPEAFAAALESLQRPGCVYITSPDYAGNMMDVAAISEVCRKYSARLLVDNAHGAHLAFLPYRCHPMQLGADYCCDSAHKMLSGLTGTAYLHVGTEVDVSPERVRDAMAVFASTSPSYLLLASLDWCNRELDSPLFRQQLEAVSHGSLQVRKNLADQYVFVQGEPLHLTIDAYASHMDGREIAAYLRENHIVVEYADAYYVVLLLSAATKQEELDQVERALRAFTPQKPAPAKRPKLPHPKQVCGIREAALAPWERIPVQKSRGRICAAVEVPCPPAIPLILSGERIDRTGIAACEGYGQEYILVVK